MEYLADAVDALIEHALCRRPPTTSGISTVWRRSSRTYWPNSITDDAAPRQCGSTDEIYDLVMAEATAHYERREQELGDEVLREVERQVMLRIIDQRWREHLEEMDYLQGGINLRAMGQKDPLVEWQREGFEMFGAMMKGIAQDFVQVRDARPGRPEPGAGARADEAPAVQNLQTSSSDDVEASGFDQAARAAVGRRQSRPRRRAGTRRRPSSRPSSRTTFDKTPRNAPCPCGSGKKFKQCHGAA